MTYCQQAGARVHDRAAFHEAVAAFEQALQALAHLPNHSDTLGLAIDLRLALGGPLYALGEHGWRLALFGEAEALARALKDRARLGRVLAQIAHVLWLTGDHDGASTAGQQALALANELGMRPLVAHCHLGLGQLYHQTGRGEQARTALTTAIDLYRAMDMTFWLPQAEAALAQMA